MIRMVADHIISPLGAGTDVNLQAVLDGHSAIRQVNDPQIWSDQFYAAAFSEEERQDRKQRANAEGLSLLESLMVESIQHTARTAKIDCSDRDTQVIIATTKGNIDLLENEVDQPSESILYRLGENVSRAVKAARPAMIVSNACISGLLAIITGARMIEAGQTRNVIVCGGDLVTRFTLAGFQSFMAVSQNPCRPYDAKRDGITLGEGVATVAMTESDDARMPFYVTGASANDANHISGPSRTGEGLYQSLQRTFLHTDLQPGMISAHGTATVYNDEMECQAFHRAGLDKTPLHSLKGIYGHTLGAAGVLESIIAWRAMMAHRLVGSVGYETHGLTLPINVTAFSQNQDYNTVLKTSSGFGGCNAAALFGI